MIKQKNNVFWFKLNGLVRYSMSHLASNLFPLYIVNEYPKSGGSWVADMLSDALNVPFPRNRLPMLKSCVMHGHMMHSWNMRNVLIVWRDGRDILVSQYYHSLFYNDRGNAPLVDQCRADLQFSDYDNIRENLPAFMEYVYETKKHPRMSWIEFVGKWADCKNCVHVKYEDLREKPVDELNRIAHSLSSMKIDLERVVNIVDNHSFEKLAGRKAGSENKKSFLRKGVVGDWKNHFTKDAKQLFMSYAGDGLVKLGYENDNSWVNE